MTTTNSHPARYIGVEQDRNYAVGSNPFCLGLLKDVRVRGGFQS